jgi:hypothetical protein
MPFPLRAHLSANPPPIAAFSPGRGGHSMIAGDSQAHSLKIARDHVCAD